ncbi:hypothetical protein [Nocardioides marmorisolisilvae]|uniref:Uncharacterized protein n=1 Tax=Nocardioides marmorisolisilvae TaxID=1542737 RepID=A0A3N0DQ17_9ACTN|nr:hypothetical protein [Nocardioides marmorisolisilvae]RNL77740.1 hypothetical protein EFL95_17245 [Nocardioides marmorisolisilvae]
MTTPTSAPRRSNPTSASWWFRSADGRLTVWQFPNPALAVWFVALVVGLLPLAPSHAATVEGLRRGALVVWALDELVRGSSPFRRVLGAVVLVGQLASLAMDWG